MPTLPTQKICFLATGSEIITGEITNTNGQNMAKALFAMGAQIGEHLVVDDEESNLIEAMSFLKSRSDAIIITGGLGPTSDDRTRFALSKLLGLKLALDDSTWQHLQHRAKVRNFKLTPNNKQQAYFPVGSTILQNDNGSAAGCQVELGNQTFFMLPGPPAECMPIFERDIIPYFEKRNFFTETRQYKWHIRGIGESQIAYELEPVAQKHGIEIAYRCSQPDLYIKLHLTPEHPTKQIISDFDDILAQYLIQKVFPL